MIAPRAEDTRCRMVAVSAVMLAVLSTALVRHARASTSGADVDGTEGKGSPTLENAAARLDPMENPLDEPPARPRQGLDRQAVAVVNPRGEERDHP